jgi:hypothetical protein
MIVGEENNDKFRALDANQQPPLSKPLEQEHVKPDAQRQLCTDEMTSEEGNKAIHSASAKLHAIRTPEIVRTTGALSSTTNFVTGGTTKAYPTDTVSSTFFENQVRSSRVERALGVGDFDLLKQNITSDLTRNENVEVSKSLDRRGDFVSDLTKPPGRPPSRGRDMQQRCCVEHVAQDGTAYPVFQPARSEPVASDGPNPLDSIKALLREVDATKPIQLEGLAPRHPQLHPAGGARSHFDVVERSVREIDDSVTAAGADEAAPT